MALLYSYTFISQSWRLFNYERVLGLGRTTSVLQCYTLDDKIYHLIYLSIYCLKNKAKSQHILFLRNWTKLLLEAKQVQWMLVGIIKWKRYHNKMSFTNQEFEAQEVSSLQYWPKNKSFITLKYVCTVN